MYGIGTLAKMRGVSHRTAQYRVHSEGWVKVEPWEVGSMKYSVNVWKKAEPQVYQS